MNVLTPATRTHILGVRAFGTQLLCEQVNEVGEHEGRPFLAMELLEGETLKHRIGNNPIAIDSLLSWPIQICEGFEAAHSRGIVHRDIKPANLFITTRGQAEVSLGCALSLATNAGR